MEKKRTDGVSVFYAENRSAWRTWLKNNHDIISSVWLIIYKKQSGISSVYYPEAVEEGLSFGWIDSKPNKRDQDSYYQFFSQRNPKSNWSKKNKETIERLEREGLMHESGQKMVAFAKESGTWTALEDVDNLIVPKDLQASLDLNSTALENFNKFPPSTRRGILEWIFNAKRSATRQKRINETVALAEKNIRANQYRQ